jgi:Tol biopolymer transport system component/DNA-binding winged helix-turn-helix (wHTH) protein
MPVGENQTFRFGPFELDRQCGQLRKDGVGLKLQGQPIQVLEILLQKPGQLVTREEIRQRLWTSDTFVDFDHSLNTAVKKLRQTLGDEADTPRYIETLPKRGYRFIGEVEREEQREDMREAAAAVLPIGQLEARPSSRMRRWTRPVISSVLVLLVIAFATATYLILKPEPMPRIVGSHVLTKTGFRKIELSRLLTDGERIYFEEARPSGLVTMQVGVNGGEASEVAAVHGLLHGIKSDRSELLYAVQTDAWAQPLPAGPPRLILKDVRWPIWTPDGRSMLFSRHNDKDLYRSNSDGTNAQKIATLPDFTDPAISPNGRRIRFGVQQRTWSIWEAGADGANPHPVLMGHKSWSGGTWSPDGKYYFFLRWDGDRDNIWSVAEYRHWWTLRKPVPVQLTFGPFSALVPVVSKDGKQLYARLRVPHGELSVYDAKSQQFAAYLGGISASYADFSRDGQWITYVSYPEGNLWRSRIDGTERRQLTAPPYTVVNPRWSPDGRFIAFTELSGGNRKNMGDVTRIYLISSDGGEPMLLPTGSEPVVGDPTWSPDSATIAYVVDGHLTEGFWGIKILDLRTEKSVMVPGSDMLWSPRWSPDGKYLVALSGFFPKKLVLFSFATQKWEELASGIWLGWPSWSRDSKQVVFADFSAGLFRTTVSDRRKEQIVSLSVLGPTSFVDSGYPWFGITPDGRPIGTRDTSIEEIYAFDLEYK